MNDLYTGTGKLGEYRSDEQARIDLRQFLTPSHNKQVEIDENKIDLSNSYEFGIGVYFIIDEPYNENWRHPDMQDKSGQEELIHGIGNSEKYNDPLEISDALNITLIYYRNYNFNTGGFESSTMFYDQFLGDKEEIHFLETPFDWTGPDKAPDELEGQTAESLDIKSIEDIVLNGEGNQVEFKPALLYNFKTGKPGISVKEKIATAICSFLNSNGSLLLVDLGDNGEIQVLYNNFHLTDSKKPKDFFQNEFD